MSIDYLSRENLLAAPPSKRAKTQLFLIENRSAYLASRSWHHIEFARADRSAQRRELAYLEAFALKREPQQPVTIQDIEQFAPQWQDDIARSPAVRATIAHLLAEKYQFDEGNVPNIRMALGLETPAVQKAYERLYKRPLSTLYTRHDTLQTGLRWRLSSITHWLDTLPPFWLAFILTTTLGISSSVIALPSAVAAIGPLLGLGVLFGLGILNIVAVTSAVEATTNSEVVAFERGFFNQVVLAYLGTTGTMLRAITLGTASILSLLSVFIGMATTLADLTAVPALVWHPIFFALVVYLLWRGSVRLPIGLMVIIGSLQILLFVLLSFLALQQTSLSADLTLFSTVDQPFNLALLGVPFGVIYLVYATQHKLIGQLARAVLPREGGSQGLRQGVLAGSLFTLVLMALWVISTTSVLPLPELARYGGTVLGLMASNFGGITAVFCGLLLILTLGLSASRDTFIVFNLIEERLPHTISITLHLPRRQGQLTLASAQEELPQAKLTYLGLYTGQPQFRWDFTAGGSHQVTCEGQAWQGDGLLANSSFSIVEATEQGALIKLATTSHLRYDGEWDMAGVSLGALAASPQSEQSLVNWILRQQQVSAQQVATHWGQSVGQARTQLDALEAQGILYQASSTNGAAHYRVRLQPKRGTNGTSKIWQALDFAGDASAANGHNQTKKALTQQQRRQPWLQQAGRFWLSLLPVILLFLIVEWLLFRNAQSFTKPFGIAGVLTAPIFAGILPLLMLLASRRKTAVRSRITRWLGHPMLVGLFCLVFLGDILLHGLVIWQHSLERIAALLVFGGVITAVWRMWRRGSFHSP